MAVVRNRDLEGAVIALADDGAARVALLFFGPIDGANGISLLVKYKRLAHGLAVDGYVRNPGRANASYVGQLNEISYDCPSVFVDHGRIEGVWPVNKNQVFGIKTVIYSDGVNDIFLRIAPRGRAGMHGFPPTYSKKIIGIRSQRLNEAERDGES